MCYCRGSGGILGVLQSMVWRESLCRIGVLHVSCVYGGVVLFHSDLMMPTGLYIYIYSVIKEF